MTAIVKRGRPRKPEAVDPEWIERLCRTIVEYHDHPGQAAIKCGVRDRTLNLWLAQGREFPNGPYGPLYDAVQRARSIVISELSQEIRASKDPRALIWQLERYDRVTFAPLTQHVEQVNVNANIDTSKLTDEELDTFRALLSKTSESNEE